MGQGFDLLGGAIVDQHFLRRNRIARLIAAIRAHPQLVGVGIGEGTAVVAQGERMEVVGDSYVLLIRIGPDQQAIQVDSHKDGDKISLADWSLEANE